MRPEITLASERDVPELCKIWKSGFSDPEEYIRYFYRENFDRLAVPVYKQNGRPVSMIHLMDAVFADRSESYPVRFVYAAATLPEYRSKGLMRSLLLSEAREAKEKGYGLFVKPAPGLTGYYNSLGFMTDSRFRILCAEKGGEKTEVTFSPLSALSYNRMRNAAFAGRPFVKWPDAHVKWCVDENAFCGGRTLSLTFEGNTYFLMGCPVGNVLRINETDMRPPQLFKAARALCELFGTGSLEAFLPEDVCPDGKEAVSSCVFNTPLCHTYANLLLF